VLPIGLVKTGFFCHRALLFKVSCSSTSPARSL